MQAELIRTMPAYQGACYFNAKNFKENRLGINEVIQKLYPNPALVPALNGFPVDPPVSPVTAHAQLSDGKMTFTWKSAAKYHVVYRFNKGEKADFSKGSAIIALTGEDSFTITAKVDENYEYYVSALDRLYNESKPVKVQKR
jgi:hypothetical protein